VSVVEGPLPSGGGEKYSFLDQFYNYFELKNVVVTNMTAVASLWKKFALTYCSVSSFKKMPF